MTRIVGREHEIEMLQKYLETDKSEFIAVYGRRRVGKTFLIREFFQNKFTLYFSGVANLDKKSQLVNFLSAINRYSDYKYPAVNSWFEVFEQIINLLDNTKEGGKKIIFIDEISWLDTKRSNFTKALEYFWNTYASAQRDVILIVCASATSWIINNIIKNRGGLHNRVTRQIQLNPFTLRETEAFLKKMKISFNRHQIIECYMIMGGIPYYLEQLDKSKSLAQNIDDLFFRKEGMLRQEFSRLYSSLFENSEQYVKIVETLSKKRMGLTRNELIQYSGLHNSGNLSAKIEELELCGFIKRYNPIGKISRETLYQLIDFYTLFYLNYIKGSNASYTNHWTNLIDNAKHRAWSGYGFEQVCLMHEDQIRKKLGIHGIISYSHSWRSKSKEEGAQIDLLIDRNDNVINLCEMKFSREKFCMDKKTHQNLMHKKSVFINETKTRKAVHLTMITTYGLVHNEYWNDIQSEVTMDDLFE